MTTTTKFELINKDGALFATTQATSFAKARSHFAASYSGKFIILCGEVKRNVNL